ncbi:Hypothetical protein D9617_20g027750 [Elsinoe fawcettii]|nr:Hypothetical protein D9617_20g027750 [Elsinoe fawcettii]
MLSIGHLATLFLLSCCTIPGTLAQTSNNTAITDPTTTSATPGVDQWCAAYKAERTLGHNLNVTVPYNRSTTDATTSTLTSGIRLSTSPQSIESSTPLVNSTQFVTTGSVAQSAPFTSATLRPTSQSEVTSITSSFSQSNFTIEITTSPPTQASSDSVSGTTTLAPSSKNPTGAREIETIGTRIGTSSVASPSEPGSRGEEDNKQGHDNNKNKDDDDDDGGLAGWMRWDRSTGINFSDLLEGIKPPTLIPPKPLQPDPDRSDDDKSSPPDPAQSDSSTPHPEKCKTRRSIISRRDETRTPRQYWKPSREYVTWCKESGNCKLNIDWSAGGDDAEIDHNSDDADSDQADTLTKREEVKYDYTATIAGTEVGMYNARYPSLSGRSGVIGKIENGKAPFLVQPFFFLSDQVDNVNLGPRDDKRQVVLERTNVEHILELQTVKMFMQFCSSEPSRLVSSQPDDAIVPARPQVLVRQLPTFSPINPAFFKDFWKEGPLAVPKGDKKYRSRFRSSIRPVDRVFEALGSSTNADDFVLLDSEINGVKAKIWSLIQPVMFENVKENMEISAQLVTWEIPQGSDKTKPANGGERSVAYWLSPLKSVIGVFEYLNHKEVNDRLWNIDRKVRLALLEIKEFSSSNSGATAQAVLLKDDWEIFFDDHLEQMALSARNWVNAVLNVAEKQFRKVEAEWRSNPYYDSKPDDEDAEADMDMDDDTVACSPKPQEPKEPNMDETQDYKLKTPEFIDFALQTIATYRQKAKEFRIDHNRKEAKLCKRDDEACVRPGQANPNNDATNTDSASVPTTFITTTADSSKVKGVLALLSILQNNVTRFAPSTTSTMPEASKLAGVSAFASALLNGMRRTTKSVSVITETAVEVTSSTEWQTVMAPSPNPGMPVCPAVYYPACIDCPRGKSQCWGIANILVCYCKEPCPDIACHGPDSKPPGPDPHEFISVIDGLKKEQGIP